MQVSMETNNYIASLQNNYAKCVAILCSTVYITISALQILYADHRKFILLILENV